MQLAIPPDLRIYNRHTYSDDMIQSNWCKRMAKDALPNCTKGGLTQ